MSLQTQYEDAQIRAWEREDREAEWDDKVIDDYLDRCKKIYMNHYFEQVVIAQNADEAVTLFGGEESDYAEIGFTGPEERSRIILAK